MSLQLRDDVCAQWLYAVTHIGKLVGCMVPTSLCLPFQARHEEYEEQYRTKLQQEEEAARRAAEFKVGQHCKAVQMFRLGYPSCMATCTAMLMLLPGTQQNSTQLLACMLYCIHHAYTVLNPAQASRMDDTIWSTYANLSSGFPAT